MCIFSTSLICIYVQTFSNILMFKKWNLIGYIAFCLLVYLNIVWSEVVGSLKYIFSCFYTKLLGYGLEWGRAFLIHEPESLWHECSSNPKWAFPRAAALSSFLAGWPCLPFEGNRVCRVRLSIQLEQPSAKLWSRSHGLGRPTSLLCLFCALGSSCATKGFLSQGRGGELICLHCPEGRRAAGMGSSGHGSTHTVCLRCCVTLCPWELPPGP